MAINFTDNVGFQDGTENLLIVPVSGASVSVSGDVTLADIGIYAKMTDSGTDEIVFYPWANVARVVQSL